MGVGRVSAALGSAGAGLLAAGAAMALEGDSHPWQMNFSEPASLVMEEIVRFHNQLLVLITVIALFVLVLMAYTMIRFRASRNPTPTKTTHNTLVEVVWTVIPIFILVVMAVPSFRLLYYMDRTADPEMTFKAIGHQWYWSYEYPDQGGFTFDAVIVEEKNLKQSQLRLLTTDNEIVLPANTNIRLLVTADDVLHSWAVPSFGVKIDAVPGRVNEGWVRITQPGMYYGMCSELCGQRHGFMPIMVRAVPKQEFEQWAAKARAAYESDRAGPKLAAVQQQ
ncbi:MAG: cytochrome c oxidase subunit II [Alphaproteobacteria bacterium]|nr:cytochrome c oxidase subunit II [Alphaproteobacteria bacterium]